MITVIGLGTKAGDLAMRARDALCGASCVLVRNECPSSAILQKLNVPYRTLDFVFEKSRNFDTLKKNLLGEIKSCEKTQKNLCYCVEGSVLEDLAAMELIKGDAAYIDGASKASSCAAACGIAGEYSSLSAFSLSGARFSLPLIVYDLSDKSLASDCKLILSEKIDEESEVFFFDGNKAERIPLYMLDRMDDFSPRCALAVPAIPLLEKKRFTFDDVVEILKRLRAPDGCPWDKVQTHESIRINAIEEAYELVDAIDLKDSDKICEEAGDVLMQSLFHALIEEEKGNFSVGDMLTALCEKLISRHTHVFGQDTALNAENALRVWEKNKMAEKHQTTFSAAVCDVPACFPALLRAQKICKRVEKGGWDEDNLQNVKQALKGEMEELEEALAQKDQAKIYEETGDFLLSCARLSRAVGVDGEMALLDAAKKLQKRYMGYEKLVRADGKDPTSLSKEERDFYYAKVKDE